MTAATAAKVLLALELFSSVARHMGTTPEPIERVACPAPAGGPMKGAVVVHALVGTNGRAESFDVAKSAGALDSAAVECVRHWLFAPSKHPAGHPIPIWTTIPVHFGDPHDAPEAIHKVPPTYPEAARDARIQGQVVVEALVDSTGNVVRTRVKTSAPGLDEAAIAAVRQWHFRPAKAAGVPVAMWLDVPIRFSLH